MGEMGKKLGEMGNGRNGIGRNGNTPYVAMLHIIITGIVNMEVVNLSEYHIHNHNKITKNTIQGPDTRQASALRPRGCLAL
jgi:hypothetical protein